MEFFLFLILCIVLIAVYSRQGVIIEKLNSIEWQIKSQTNRAPQITPSVTQQNVQGEAPVQAYGETKADADGVWAQGTQSGVAPTAFVAEAPHAAPAPMPSRDYVMAAEGAPTQKPAFADEAQEEKSARWLGRIGGFMIFLGMVFFVNYAIDEGWLTPPGQFILGIFVGVAMLLLGHRLRIKHLSDIAYQRYATALLGGGIAVLYLIIYSGFSILHYADNTPVIGQSTAFVLMILVTMVSMVLSVVSDSRFLAISATVGGFLTPVMVSTHENHLVTLSLYIIILNAGVMSLGWFKKWTWLNFSALFGTWILFGGWLGTYFFGQTKDEERMTVFLFITIFFLQFFITVLLRHFREKEESTTGDFVFLSLSAGMYFLTSYNALYDVYKDFFGFFALLLATLHLFVAYISYTSTLRDRKLNLFLVGVAVVFLSIAVPLQLSGYWIALSWLIESVVLLFIGRTLHEGTLNVFGWIVFVLAIPRLFDDVAKIRYGDYTYNLTLVHDLTPFFNVAFLLLIMAVVAFYAIAYIYRTSSDERGKKIVAALYIFANLLTLYTITSEISIKYDQQISALRERAPATAAPFGYENSTMRAYDRGIVIPNSYVDTRALENQKSTAHSIFWALYAILLLVLGFMHRSRALRVSGLILIFITAMKVFFMVWGLGQLYRIIASIVFGILALVASFIYVKYKHLLKDIIYDNK
jgi:uncharacterized membrane protein